MIGLQAMRVINETKKDNAAVLLADGTNMGTATSSACFKDLKGLIGPKIKEFAAQRG